MERVEGEVPDLVYFCLGSFVSSLKVCSPLVWSCKLPAHAVHSVCPEWRLITCPMGMNDPENGLKALLGDDLLSVAH